MAHVLQIRQFLRKRDDVLVETGNACTPVHEAAQKADRHLHVVQRDEHGLENRGFGRQT